MRDTLAFLGLLSAFFAVVGLLMFNDSALFLTFFLGIGFSIIFFALMNILDHLKSVDKELENNSNLIINLISQTDKNVNTIEEKWKCSHCGFVNQNTESTCKSCGFH